MNRLNSKKMFDAAKKVMPGGVSSPVRGFGSVEGDPIFIKEAKGAHIIDVDGNKYIDYVGSWGPAILGHCHPEVLEAVIAAAKSGFSFGAPTEAETDLAQTISTALPSMDMVRFVSSGTEACMSAIRLARGYTGRDTIIKFSGNYHGHGDMLLVKAGSGVATFGLPDSPGVPKGAANNTLVAPYNDLGAVRAILEANNDAVAAIIVEPIVGNAGFIQPSPEFLPGLKSLTEEYGALLILDEVMTGFRVAWGGAQSLYRVAPDLTTLGKVIGGGMPLAAYGGRREIMEMVAPAGPVYQAGTLSGNPIATACGLKTLEILNRPATYKTLGNHTKFLTNGLKSLAVKYKIPFITGSRGGMFGLFFTDVSVENFEDAQKMDVARFRKYHKGMLERGIYLAPSAFEAAFVSLAHTSDDLERTLAAAEEVFADLL